MASLPLPPSSAQLSAVMLGESAGIASKQACALGLSNARCLYHEHAVMQLRFLWSQS